ncbi:metallophosphoesterase family protein [Chitinophaga arvensicola]|uniref:Calcineurin-like phosphoesterase n=1 Tax=Chitinophaga arvensicola TaxID=29529 RepID=A0A1I0SBA4_9BACT|nr:metallophosphoesterase [Chitinophaga arvensicola]SEW53974.1 Calcineurin-like phosphoesterase [Chitinophaga arvensicola]
MKMKVAYFLPLLAVAAISGCKKNDDPVKEETPSTIQFVFTSDAHYGITRPAFRGGANVDAHTVNAAMVASMNTLPALTLPSDGGVNAGKKIGSVDYVIEAGDIANRMEVSANVQTAAVSWTQFKADYLTSLTLKNQQNQPAGFLMVPGNHDVSNTIGYYAKMQPLTDASSMAEIYNLMLKPSLLRTPISYSYNGDRINYSRDIAGVHFCFIQMWPDSAVRIWLNKDLQNVKTETPVVIVAHDQPAVVSNHFTNPNGDHGINNTDKFDNVLDEHFKDGTSASVAGVIEQRAFAAFLKQHTNIRLYLHGHVHESKFYTWTGPDNDVSLAAASADSPMKGLVSAADETKLTYLFAALDPATMQLTLRECYWNSVPGTPATPVQWGKTITVDLKKKG